MKQFRGAPSVLVTAAFTWLRSCRRRFLKETDRVTLKLEARGVLNVFFWGGRDVIICCREKGVSGDCLWGRILFWSLSVRFLILSCLSLLTGCVQNKSLHQIIIVQSFKMAAELCLPNGSRTRVCLCERERERVSVCVCEARALKSTPVSWQEIC